MINAVAVVQEFYRAMGAGDGARSRSPVPVDEASSWHVYNTLIDVERAIGNPPG